MLGSSQERQYMSKEVEIPDNDGVDLNNLTDIQLLDVLDRVQEQKERIQKEIATRIMSRSTNKTRL